VLKGKIVNLASVEKEDLKQLMGWRNNPEFRKYFREYRELNFSMQKNWYEQHVVNNPNTIMFSVRRNKDNLLLGCCGLVYINWLHRHCDLSLYIGWKNSYIDNKNYAKESCHLLFKYAFDELCLNKIWTEIYEFDTKKNELYKKLGFKQDGLLRQNYLYKGKWWNSRILSLLSSEYKRIK
jgi:RimJ/RimL family protein N-acetyltransferase